MAGLEAHAAALGPPLAIAAEVARVLPRVAPEERARIEAGLKREAVGVLRTFAAVVPLHVPAGPGEPGRESRASHVAASYAGREVAAEIVAGAFGRIYAPDLRPELRKTAALGTPSPRIREAIGDAWAAVERTWTPRARDPRELAARELGDRVRGLGSDGGRGRGGIER